MTNEANLLSYLHTVFPVIRLVRAIVAIFRQDNWSFVIIAINSIYTICIRIKTHLGMLVCLITSVSLIFVIEATYAPLIGASAAFVGVVLGYWVSLRGALDSPAALQIYGRFFQSLRAKSSKLFAVDEQIKSVPAEVLPDTIKTQIETALSQAVMYNRLCRLTAIKLKRFHRGNWSFILAAISVVSVYFWTGVMFSLIYYGMYLNDTSSFFVESGACYFDFMYFSMNAMFFSTTDAVSPTAAFTQSVYLLHRFLLLLIGAIFIAHLMTHRNRRYSDELTSTISLLDQQAKEMESHIVSEFGVGTIEEAVEGLREAKAGFMKFILWLTNEINTK